MIKLTSILIMFIFLIGCKNSNQKIQSIDNENFDTTSILNNNELKTNIRKKYKFDNSVIPENLIEFYKSMDTTFRLPTLGDYDDYYFTGYYDKKLPYFCSGFFNNDTILDYGLVLIRDTIEQLIYSFHADNDKFSPYLINKRELIDSENNDFKVVVFNIHTVTNKSLEAIDTTYNIKFDAISVSDIYESSEYVSVWDENKDTYTSLWFN